MTSTEQGPQHRPTNHPRLSIGLYNVVKQNAADAVSVMARGLTKTPQGQDDAIKCLQVCIESGTLRQFSW